MITNTARVKYLLAVAASGWIVGLAACANSYDIGLQGISPESRWATVFEQSGQPPTTQLVQFDLQTGKAKVLDKNASAESDVSPEGRYVLSRSNDGWLLVDETSNQQIKVGTPEEALSFLPDGEIMVASQAKNLAQFYLITNLSNPQNRTLLIDQIVVSFGSQRLPQPSWQTGEMPLSACAANWSTGQRVWVMINSNSAVLVLTATPSGVHWSGLSSNLSTSIASLLERQQSSMNSNIELMRPSIRAELEREAQKKGKELSPAELDTEADLTLQSIRSYLLIQSLFATPSPDGTKLLFLRAESMQGGGTYTLYLIDLKSGADELPLSTETKWQPSFAFSPDGTQILYESNVDGGRSLYIANADGSNRQRVINEGAVNPCWY